MANELAVITNWIDRNNRNDGFKDMTNVIKLIHGNPLFCC